MTDQTVMLAASVRTARKRHTGWVAEPDTALPALEQQFHGATLPSRQSMAGARDERGRSSLEVFSVERGVVFPHYLSEIGPRAERFATSATALRARCKV